MKLEGYISKKVIRYWLDHYEELASNDKPVDAVPGNSGPREYDGVYMSQLNKIMLDKAMDELPGMLKTCCKARWIVRMTRKEACRVLQVSRGTYDHYCNEAVEFIYRYLNGEMVGVKQLMKKIYN